MIFVTVGTHEQPFDRLLIEIDRLASEKVIDEKIFIQSGYSAYKPKACDYKPFLGFNEMKEKMESARLIITHCGSSTMMQALQLGKPPIVVPRQKRYHEHVDDHQVLFAGYLKEKEKIIVVTDIRELGSNILGYDSMIPKQTGTNSMRRFQDEADHFARRLDEAIQRLF